MPDLTDFLLARIAEDEMFAHTWHSVPCGLKYSMHPQGGAPVVCTCKCGEPVKRLAECEAKRRIIQQALDIIASFGDWDAPAARAAGGHLVLWHDVNRRERSHAHDRLHALASPYADHPDFKEEWRV